MKKYFIITLSALLIIGTSILAASADDEVSVSATLDRDTIGLDEQAVLQVVVIGANQNLPEPKLPTLPMFELYSQGRSSNLSIKNGVVSSSVTYRYLLLPNKAGTFLISPISLVYKNKRYTAGQMDLTVLNKGTSANKALQNNASDPEGQSRDYFLEAAIDNKNPFVNQQITLTLKFFIGIQYYGSPELVEPTTTGFWTEILGNKAPYYQKINNRNYKVIERKYALFPTQTGELEIGRAMIKVTVPSKSRNRDVFGGIFNRGEEISLRSQVVKVIIKPLPQAGKPKNFTGTIGNFSISTAVNKNNVEANQPVTVTIKISGTGNIKSVAEPFIPEMENEFRIYQSSTNENISKVSDKIGGTKIFEEVFIPNRPGQTEIPSITYNFFDPKAKKYKVISTKPIKLSVSKPEGYVSDGAVPYVPTGMAIGAGASDIRYIKSDLGQLSKPGQLILTRPIYIIVNSLPLLALIGLVAIRRRQEKLAGNVGLLRSRTAVKEAKKRLTTARKIAASGKTEEFYVEIYNVITLYIADKLNISSYGLTSDKIKELLENKKANPDLIDETLTLLKQCDYARFAPSMISKDDIEKSAVIAEDIMVKIYEVRF